MIIETIETHVYRHHSDHGISQSKPMVLCSFDIKKFPDGHMAYVCCIDLGAKDISRLPDFYGNSMWSLGYMSLRALRTRISNYKGVDQIKADFDC